MKARLKQFIQNHSSGFGVICAIMLATVVQAADVKFTVSPREAYVNQPITLQIDIENAKTFSRPQMPKIAGAAVNPTPAESRRTMTQIANGKVINSETITLSYRIVPFQRGAISIPPISLTADGQTFTSEAIEVIITESETGDLMFAELLADRPTVYLGESVTLRLKLWIKPFTDRQHQIRLQAEHMWDRIDRSATNWGPFREALLPKSNNPFSSVQVAAEEVIREDEQGNRGAYYLYEVEGTVWPTQTGPLQLEQPVIVVNYPQRLARQDDFFSRGSYAIADMRPISVAVPMPPVDVVAPPSEGQPGTFNGAVGTYSITTSARPTDVAVGDPITLVITIQDHGDPASAADRLNLLPPPPLDRVEPLAENFRIPSDPLAGTISGITKIFTQTIRATSDQVTEIPPIPISYFDPLSETFITRTSDPIAITVRAGSQIGTSDIIAAPSTAMANPRSQLTSASAGLLANYPAEAALASAEPFRLTPVSIAWLGVPPLLFVGIAVLRTSSRFRQRHASAIRQRVAGKRAIARLNRVESTDVHSQAQTVLAAVGDFIADRLAMQSRAMTSGDVAATLRQRAANDDLVTEIQDLLNQCERIVYAGSASNPESIDKLVPRAKSCIKKLERARLI